MKEKASAIMLILLLATLLLGALEIQRIEAEPTTWVVDDDGHRDFRVIQDAVNIAQQGDTVFVCNGTYHEHVVTNKSISLIGEDRSTTVIDGSNVGTVVLVAADNVIVKGFAVRNGRSGIVVSDSYNCSVKDNLVEDNSYQGIFINKSWNCTVSGNHAVGTKSGYGINVNASKNVLVEKNGATGNYFDGIGLLDSNGSVVQGNTVNDNHLIGIWIDQSYGNIIYNNNFFNNGIQVRSNTPINAWDYGAEGNYWGDYAGVDADGDGIGDEPYIVDKETQQQDNHPLICPYVNEIYLSIDTEPPVASFTYFLEEIFVNETMSFNASSSYDSVGKHAIVLYDWEFGDGTIKNTTNPVTNHTYFSPGNYTVVLTVVDAAGNKDSALANIHVQLENVTDKQPFPTLEILILVIILGAIIFALWAWKTGKLSH